MSRQILNALDYRLQTEQQIVFYVNTAWLLGTKFDTNFPAAQKVLSDKNLKASEKANFLKKWTMKMFEVLGKK